MVDETFVVFHNYVSFVIMTKKTNMLYVWADNRFRRAIDKLYTNITKTKNLTSYYDPLNITY